MHRRIHVHAVDIHVHLCYFHICFRTNRRSVCLKLARKEPDCLPSPSTDSNINIQIPRLVNKQLQEDLSEKINTDLDTDETSKVGMKYDGYVYSILSKRLLGRLIG